MKVVVNFISVLLLFGLITTPIYFAQNFTKVAGVKSHSPYLIISQIEKFPNLTFSQNGENYTINYTTLGPSQAFLGILILSNPTEKTQTYNLDTTPGGTKLFFGKEIKNQQTKISIPSQLSVPISLLSEGNSSESKAVVFTISVE